MEINLDLMDERSVGDDMVRHPWLQKVPNLLGNMKI